METNERFEKALKRFAEERPTWLDYFSDSTFFELMDWFDYNYHPEFNTEEGEHTDEAHDFANYVFDKVEDKSLPSMSVHKQLHGGYEIINIAKEELEALSRILTQCRLTEKRLFYGLSKKIEKLLENDSSL